VAANVRARGLQTPPVSQFYTSYLQYFQPTNMYFIVRSSLELEPLVASVKEAIRASYAEQPVFNVSTMDEIFSNSIARPRFNAFLTGAFALLASIMAASGLYSVISCLVSQRTTEIAIRIALGAGRGDVIRTVLETISLWVAGGLAGGLALGMGASNTIRGLSNSAVSGSAVMYITVALFFLVVTLTAIYLPVRRACRLSPALAMKCE
jgi:putative ABC transport system permease protein